MFVSWILVWKWDSACCHNFVVEADHFQQQINLVVISLHCRHSWTLIWTWTSWTRSLFCTLFVTVFGPEHKLQVENNHEFAFKSEQQVLVVLENQRVVQAEQQSVSDYGFLNRMWSLRTIIYSQNQNYPSFLSPFSNFPLIALF